MVYRKLLSDFEGISRGIGGLPKVPSKEDKNILTRLEKIKVDNPFDGLYDVRNRMPLMSGASPERIVVEVRLSKEMFFITYWNFWSYDTIPGDHEDWEPVTLVYEKQKLIGVDARIHDALVSYTPLTEDEKVKVYFYKFGHTPVVKVRDLDCDIEMKRSKDGLDRMRKEWLHLCFDRANGNKWCSNTVPDPESKNAPLLDTIEWKKWGKHSVYMRT